MCPDPRHRDSHLVSHLRAAPAHSLCHGCFLGASVSISPSPLISSLPPSASPGPTSLCLGPCLCSLLPLHACAPPAPGAPPPPLLPLLKQASQPGSGGAGGLLEAPPESSQVLEGGRPEFSCEVVLGSLSCSWVTGGDRAAGGCHAAVELVSGRDKQREVGGGQCGALQLENVKQTTVWGSRRLDLRETLSVSSSPWHSLGRLGTSYNRVSPRGTCPRQAPIKPRGSQRGPGCTTLRRRFSVTTLKQMMRHRLRQSQDASGVCPSQLATRPRSLCCLHKRQCESLTPLPPASFNFHLLISGNPDDNEATLPQHRVSGGVLAHVAWVVLAGPGWPFLARTAACPLELWWLLCCSFFCKVCCSSGYPSPGTEPLEL